VNPAGRPENLRAQQWGNSNAVRHGVYSRGALEPKAREIAESLMAAPYAIELDLLGAQEVGALLARIEEVDSVLDKQGLTDRRGKPHPLLELRARLSGQLRRWLQEYAATPASRARWTERLGTAEDIVDVLRREVGQGRALLEAAQDRGDLRLPSPPEEQP